MLVVFHDDTLDGTTDHSGTISDLPWSVVKEAKVGGTEPIPRFDDVLDALPGVRFNIEPKTDRRRRSASSRSSSAPGHRPHLLRLVLRQPAAHVRKALGPDAVHGHGHR